MKTQEFIELLKEALEVENQDLTKESNLKDISGYDSMSILIIIALVDEKFSKKVTGQQLASITTISSLIDLIGLEYFD